MFHEYNRNTFLTMNKYFECKRCLYKTIYKGDIKKHLAKQKKCQNNNDFELDMTEEEILKWSLTKKNENGYIVENKSLTCEWCQKTFSRRDKLSEHQKKICNEKNKLDFLKSIMNQQVLNNVTIDNSVNNSNNVINNTTNNTTNNITNHINVNFNILRGVEESWDLSKINYDRMFCLLNSDHKFTNTLNEILKNESNMNVIVCDNEYAVVFKKTNNRFEIEDKVSILDSSMKKLYLHLKHMINDFVTSSNKPEDLNGVKPTILVKNEEISIDEKYKEYIDSEETQKQVHDMIHEIYEKHRKETIETHKDKIMGSVIKF